MNNNPIGIFDSGIGGLSIVKQIKKDLPKESIVYLADKVNFPYGEKTPDQIKKISKKNVEWLLSQNSKIIVVACNTATVNSISFLREKFPLISFVGMEPAVKPAAKQSKRGIIVLSSPKATKSKQLSLLIKKYADGIKVFNIGSLKLVQAVEKKLNTNRIKKILKEAIPQKTLEQSDTVVLGCTHFPLIRQDIQEFVGRNIKVIDSGEAVVKRIKTVLEEKELLSTMSNPSYKFFSRGKKRLTSSDKFKLVVQ